MSRAYFRSAGEAASRLGLPLLLASGSSDAVPRAARRLSAHAPDPILGARLYHRIRSASASRSQAIWIASPAGGEEHLSWSVSLCEHAARDGKTAFLVDLDRSPSLQVVIAGEGYRLPDLVGEHLRRFGLRDVAGWASDLQGVRIVVPVEKTPESEPMSSSPEWILVLARSVPETLEEVERITKHADGVILAAGIRDHTEEELLGIVEQLRAAQAELLGLIALGPVPTPTSSPLDRWEGACRQQPETKDEEPNGTREGGAAAPTEEGASHAEASRSEAGLEQGIELDEPTVGLIAEWERQRVGRRKKRIFAWFAFAVLLLATALWFVRPWERLSSAGDATVSKGSQTGSQDNGDRVRSQPVVADDSQTPPPAERDPQPVLEESTGVLSTSDRGERAGAEGIVSEDSLETNVETEVIETGWADTFVVHLSSFRDHSDAERAIAELQALGLEARIVGVVLEGRGAWHRVVVGAFPDSMSASIEATRLREQDLVPFAQILGRGGLGKGRPRGTD